MDFSLRWLLLLRITGRFWRTVLTVVAHRLKCPKACGVSGSGIEFLSPALVDGFFTTEPSGKHPRPRELRAFFSCMAWRAIPGPLSKRKRRLDSLEAAQGAPRDPRRELRGKLSPLLPLQASPDSPGESGLGEAFC